MKFKEYKGLDLVAAGNEVLDRWKTWCYHVPNNFIKQMHLSRNQYIRKYQQRVVGRCKTTGNAVWNSFCEQCTELSMGF